MYSMWAINYTDLPTPDKGKSGDSWKKAGDSTKSSEPFSIGGINCYQLA